MSCRNEKGQQKTSQDRKKLEQPVVVHCTANGFQKCHRNQLSFSALIVWFSFVLFCLL
jgi:hypothetical protein